jgi:hypothetical protein
MTASLAKAPPGDRRGFCRLACAGPGRSSAPSFPSIVGFRFIDSPLLVLVISIDKTKQNKIN